MKDATHQCGEVCVIGGGVAGIAAASGVLAAGMRVTLIERASMLGGKIHGWSESGRSIEHGVHGFWPCYTQFFKLCHDVGIPMSETFIRANKSALVYPDGTYHTVTNALSGGSGPFFLGRWLLDTPGLSIADLVSGCGLLRRCAEFRYPRDYFELDRVSFADFMAAEDVSDRFRRIVLEPFVLSLFFSTSEKISAGAVMAALQVYVLPNAQASIPSWLRGSPSVLLFDRFAKALTEAGCELILGSSAMGLAQAGSGRTVVTFSAGHGAGEQNLSFPAGDVVENSYAECGGARELYLGRWGGELRCLSRRCTHMGCIVDWHGNSNEFVCPCHQGRYDDRGHVVQGPPTVALERVEVVERDGNVVVPVGQQTRTFDAVVIATNLEAARAILSRSERLDDAVMAKLRRLDTTPVIVVRLWFKALHYDPEQWQAGLVLEMPFIDNYFILNSISDTYDHEGVVVEVQNYRTDPWLAAGDNDLVAAALTDLRKFLLIDSEPFAVSVQRHVALFTRYGPGMARHRPSSGRQAPGLYLAGDWTEPEVNCWMTERATVTGLIAAADVISDI